MREESDRPQRENQKRKIKMRRRERERERERKKEIEIERERQKGEKRNQGESDKKAHRAKTGDCRKLAHAKTLFCLGFSLCSLFLTLSSRAVMPLHYMR